MRPVPAASGQFLEVVENLHATAVGEQDWASTFGTMVDFIGGHALELPWFDPVRQKVVGFESARLDPSVHDKYVTDVHPQIMARNPRMSLLLDLVQGAHRADSDVWSRRERDRQCFFTDVMYPAGLYDCLNGCVRRSQDDSPWLFIHVHFTKKQGAPRAASRQRLAALLPHLRRAYATFERLGQAQRETSTLTEALDRVREAVALVDDAGRIRKANRRAAEVLADGQGLALDKERRLVFSDREARADFLRALESCTPAITPRSGETLPPSPVTVHKGETPALLLTLQPLPRNLAGAFRATAILFLVDLSARPVDTQTALRRLYGLSPTEARLTQALGNGTSLREFAKASDISYETARTHLRRIFLKTGSRRQSDLVRIVRRLS